MKKIRLRRWVKVVLFILLGISLFFMVCDCDNNSKLLIKNIVCSLISMISFFLLGCYGGYDD